MGMSELKLIVDQAMEEIGGWNDAAVDRWSELSGVDIRAIDENTPFDIEVANKLLATFPQVMAEMMAGPAPTPPAEEPSPEEVITELSEIAQGLSEAISMAPEEPKPPEPEIPEVGLETGVSEEVPAEIPSSSSIEALIKELESLAAGSEPAPKEELPVAEEAPEEAKEALVPEVPEEAPPATVPSWEIPAPVAEELEKATRIMEELEAGEYNLSSLETRIPGFQAACLIKDGKVVARHSKRDVDWTALLQAVVAANGVFKAALGIDERLADELVMGLGNLFVLGFLIRDAQLVVILKSDRLGAARAYVSAALKSI
jgi:hypothetical protein